jgi:hypothetical protein
VSAAAKRGEETRIAAPESLACWLLTARPGERFVYAEGPAMLPGPTQELIAALLADGRVMTHQRRRATDQVREHFLIVREPPRPETRTGETLDVAARFERDEAIETIFDAMERAARRRRRCPSLRDLARIAGLATRNQAAWRVRRLEEQQRIRTEIVAGPDGAPWRIVHVGRLSSARPPLRPGSGQAQ